MASHTAGQSAVAEDLAMMLVAPLVHVEQVELNEGNSLLVEWHHKMGICNRPMGTQVAHALFAHGNPVAIAFTATLVNETCAGKTRDEAIELARLCACRPGLNRVMLRLWREFVFPAFNKSWAVSYQDEALHSGNTYRFDGWRVLGRSHSGTDRRSGRKGRNKTIWGWTVVAEPVA